MYDELIRTLRNESKFALPSQTRKALIEAANAIEKQNIVIAGLNETVKGLVDDMPQSCGYCPLRHKARDGDECYLGASLTEYQKRPDDCPLPYPMSHV